MISGTQTQADKLGQLDWIYWLDIKKWHNALVIQGSYDTHLSEVSLYFKNVHFTSASHLLESKKTFNNENPYNAEYDLVFCSVLLEQLGDHPEKLKNIL